MHGGLEDKNRDVLLDAGLEILLSEPEPVEVWPENWASVEVFDVLATQWSIAPSGRPVGLRYEVVPFALRMCAVPAQDRRAVFEDLRVMEVAVLSMINKRP